jgi:hypothetical protein
MRGLLKPKPIKSMIKFVLRADDDESDSEGCPSYDGDSDSSGAGDGSTGEGV